ncbi:MAG: hypothetical protein PHU46_08135 [Rhodocyclaceae bacterium]|nr:hypothetical protein [Rhodocyclaceae bacterium]
MFAIKQKTMDDFERQQLKAFEQRCVQFLREEFPENAAMSGPRRELEAVRAGIQCAFLRDIRAEKDVVKYLYLRQLLGADFDTHPASGGVSAILNDASRPVGQRLDQLMDLLAARMEKQEERTVR